MAYGYLGNRNLGTVLDLVTLASILLQAADHPGDLFRPPQSQSQIPSLLFAYRDRVSVDSPL
jgi:hypothetical protein